MLIGIDPKVDYAFKFVFGREKTSNILCALLNAILRPSPDRRLVSAEILNPFVDRELFPQLKGAHHRFRLRADQKTVLHVRLADFVSAWPGGDDRVDRGGSDLGAGEAASRCRDSGRCSSQIR